MSKRFWTVGFPISIACSLVLWALIFWAVSAFWRDLLSPGGRHSNRCE